MSMKMTIAFLTLFIGLPWYCDAATEPLQAANGQAIEEVRSGKRMEACAAWWGYDPEDATVALQAAIDSGAKKVIVENLGAPWNVEPILLASDQELVLEKGVVLQAKRGSFKSVKASLLTAMGKKNLAITGPGATIKMWKQDYARTPYEKSEFRNAVKLRDCENVKITGLTIVSSGGDGIYLGGDVNRNVVIRDVICDDNYRQGISVISAENLLIENCVLKNTGGTAPRAGIDFEPNKLSDRLVNCVMRNCVSENNEGGGYLFALPNLSDESKEISIRLEKCRSLGNSVGLQLRTSNTAPCTAVRGTVQVIDCQFEKPETSGIRIVSKPASAAKVRFERCQIADAVRDAAILFMSRVDDANPIGGVEFVDCLVKQSRDQPAMQFVDLSGILRIEDVTGDLTVDRAGKKTPYVLDKSRIDAWMPSAVVKEIPRYDPTGICYVPAFDTMPAKSHAVPYSYRGVSEYLLWAVRGEKASFHIRVREHKMGPPTFKVFAPSGEECRLTQTSHDKEAEYSFSANETGAYRIQCNLPKGFVQVRSTNCRLCFYSASAAFHFSGVTDELFFWVPAGTREFAVTVAGATVRERVKAAVIDPSGKEVVEQDNIDAARQFIVQNRNVSRGEVWSLHIGRPSQGVFSSIYHVKLQGIPPLLASEKEAILKPRYENSLYEGSRDRL